MRIMVQFHHQSGFRSILESGVAVAGKSIHEHNEVIGMDSALRFLNRTLLNMDEISVDVSGLLGRST